MLAETEEAIRHVLAEREEVELAPRRAALRKMQHRIIAGRGLLAQSTGKEPRRRLVIRPPEEE
jgi:predicted RNA-binding protein Jag